MEVQIIVDSGVSIVGITGEIDGRTAGEAQQHILPLLKQDAKVLLDMTNVPYMSSAGLRMLLLLYRQAGAAQSKIGLVGLAEDIRDTMLITGFLEYFSIFESLDAAKTSL